MSCVKNDKIVFGVDIMIHVLILFTIIGVFFMTYTSKLEQKAINGQMEDAISKGLDKIKKKTVEGDEQIIANVKRRLSKPNAASTTNNTWLFKSIIQTNVFLLLLSVTTIYLIKYQCNMCFDLTHILLMNVITFSFIGIVEYLFFVNVGLKYIPSKPSTISTTVFDHLTTA